MCIYHPLPHLFLTADLDFLVVVVHLVDGHNVVNLSFKLNSETNGSQSLGLFTGPDRKSYGLVFVVHFAFGLIDCISVGVGIAGMNPVFMEDLITKAGFQMKYDTVAFFVKFLIWNHPDDSVDEWQQKINDAKIPLQLPSK